MFYIYGVDGLRCEGSMERLAARKKVKGPVRAAAIENSRAQGQNPGRDVPRLRPGLAAYQQPGKPRTQLEPVIRVSQIMTSRVYSIDAGAPLQGAWLKLAEKSVRQLVVTSPRNEVQGLVSDRDILEAFDSRRVGGNQKDLRVLDVMPREVITTNAKNDIRKVAHVLALHHLDAMPVTDKAGYLAGIVTRGDILRILAENPRLTLWA